MTYEEAYILMMISVAISSVIAALVGGVVGSYRRDNERIRRAEMFYPDVLWLRDHDQAEYVCDCPAPGRLKIYRMKLRARFGV